MYEPTRYRVVVLTSWDRSYRKFSWTNCLITWSERIIA